MAAPSTGDGLAELQRRFPALNDDILQRFDVENLHIVLATNWRELAPGEVARVIAMRRVPMHEIWSSPQSFSASRSAMSVMTVALPTSVGPLRVNWPVTWSVMANGLCVSCSAATRLMYGRLTLLIRAEPSDLAEESKSPLGSSWLLARYRHRWWVAGRQSVFTHAMRDPLFLLTTELPRTMVLELSERSQAWPADLRQRWTYAAAVGAFSGCVF